MKNIFDQPVEIDRSGFVKFNPHYLNSLYGSEDIISFWVAETDFLCPPPVKEALLKTVESGVYGYRYKTMELKESLSGWYRNRHRVTLEPSNIIFTTSVLTGIAAAIDEFSDIGDGVIIQPPVYQEFKSCIRPLGRKVITNKLIETDGKYQIDFDDLEEKAAEPANKILILCSPHNPVGKIWGKAELTKVLTICVKQNVLLLCDEIHADIIYKGHTFTSIVVVSESVEDPVMMFGSPGKTFGIPGISDAFIYTDNPALKEKMKARIMRFHLGKSNAFTNAATQAAYAHGSDWLDEMIVYLQSNIDFIYGYLKSELPQVVFTKPEGTYQVWLDFRNTGLDTKTIGQKLATQARVGLNIGHMYGREGAGFARMNIATQRSTIEKGMERIKMAFNN